MKNLDGTFSAANYYRTWLEQARRGRDLSGLLAPLAPIDVRLRALRAEHRTKLRAEPEPSRDVLRVAQRVELAEILAQRKAAIHNTLATFAQAAALRIMNNAFSLGLVRNFERNGKLVYRLNALDDGAGYFLIKQLERNVRDAFDVSMRDRHTIVRRAAALLSDRSPKSLLRADISACFESISHSELRRMITDQPLLSQTTREFISRLLDDYAALSGKPTGLPRGVGLSSYLAEAFLKNVDREISTERNVTFYARYVDDILIIVTGSDHEPRVRSIREKLTQELRVRGLSRNRSKERLISTTDRAGERRISVLGYAISVVMSSGKVKLDISDERFREYKRRIDVAFDRYASAPSVASETALVHRVKFLTSNHRSSYPGGSRANGVLLSHRAMDAAGRKFELLDNYLAERARLHCQSHPDLASRLMSYSFCEGFENSRMIQISPRRRRQIVSAWKVST